VANSETVRIALLAQGLPERKIVVIHNGVAIPPPLDSQERERLRGSVDAAPGESLVGMVARLDSDAKDHATLLRAAARLRLTFPALRVVLVGEGFARASLETLARDLHIENAVTFTGYRADARQLLGAFDVSVLLSYTEGFSNVVLESMAWGVPLAITDIPANREAAGELAGDLLVPVGDVDSTAAAIARLLADPALGAAIGRQARARAAACFSLEAQAERTMELYESLLAEKRG
jgi:glycosyltransferase involved in cell wall biosynthesis